MEQLKVLHTRSASAYIQHGNIFTIEYKCNIKADLKDFAEGYGMYAEFADDRDLKILMDIGMECSFDQAAFDLAIKNGMRAIAEAVVVKTIGMQLLIESYILKRKGTIHPVRLFRNKDKAIEWLLSIAQ